MMKEMRWLRAVGFGGFRISFIQKTFSSIKCRFYPTHISPSAEIKCQSVLYITHHSDQHVKEQNWDENHENDENRFGQIRIGNVVQLRVLSRETESHGINK